MTDIKKTDFSIWVDARFEVLKWEQKQKEQIESVRRTLSFYKKGDAELTVQEAIVEMIDFAYSEMLVKRINEENL